MYTGETKGGNTNSKKKRYQFEKMSVGSGGGKEGEDDRGEKPFEWSDGDGRWGGGGKGGKKKMGSKRNGGGAWGGKEGGSIRGGGWKKWRKGARFEKTKRGRQKVKREGKKTPNKNKGKKRVWAPPPCRGKKEKPKGDGGKSGAQKGDHPQAKQPKFKRKITKFDALPIHRKKGSIRSVKTLQRK